MQSTSGLPTAGKVPGLAGGRPEQSSLFSTLLASFVSIDTVRSGLRQLFEDVQEGVDVEVGGNTATSTGPIYARLSVVERYDL